MSTLPKVKSPWFDSYGYFVGTLPDNCVADCSHSGQCDEDVKHWRQRLEFHVPRERTIAYLREFGSWTADELNAKSDEGLAEIVLWLACCEIREAGEWFGVVL